MNTIQFGIIVFVAGAICGPAIYQVIKAALNKFVDKND